MRRVGRSFKFAVSVPEALYREVEKARRSRRRTRSSLVAEALEEWLATRLREERDQADERGYRLYPEAEEEILAAERSAADLLAEVPWD
jgi:metal-responsive CopG/Arc/MetJ family transcriptional regulator